MTNGEGSRFGDVQVNLDDFDLEVTSEREERTVVSSEDIGAAIIQFSAEPRENQSQFPDGDVYWSYEFVSLLTGTRMVLNSGSKRLKRLADDIATSRDGALTGAAGILVKEGQRFETEWKWAAWC